MIKSEFEGTSVLAAGDPFWRLLSTAFIHVAQGFLARLSYLFIWHVKAGQPWIIIVLTNTYGGRRLRSWWCVAVSYWRRKLTHSVNDGLLFIICLVYIVSDSKEGETWDLLLPSVKVRLASLWFYNHLACISLVLSSYVHVIVATVLTSANRGFPRDESRRQSYL